MGKFQEDIKHFLSYYFLAVLFSITPQLLYSQTPTVVIQHSDQHEIIGKKVYFLEEKHGKLTADQVLETEVQAEFQLWNKDVFTRPATKHAFWFKFRIENQTSEDLWLDIGNTYPSYLDFYAVDSLGKLKEVRLMGASRPDSLKFFDHNMYWFPVNKSTAPRVNVYYLRVESTMPFLLPFHVATLRTLEKNRSIGGYLTAGFVGIMLIMFLYNLFLYLSTKEHVFFWYLGYLFWMSFGIPFACDHPFVSHLEFWFVDKPWWIETFVGWHSPAYFFIGMFCIYYLRLKETGKWFYYAIVLELVGLVVVSPVLLVFGVEQVEIVNEYQLLIFIFYLTCLFASYYLIAKKNKFARFYALGWTCLIGLSITFIAVNNGLIEYNVISRYILYLAVVLEIWFFSLALGDKINIIRREKDLAQKKYLTLVESQKQTLQVMVNERTEELQSTMDELETINSELVVQKDELDETNAAKDKLFAVIGHDLMSPIASIRSLLELSISTGMSQERFNTYADKLYGKVEDVHFMLGNLLHWASSQKDGIVVHPMTIELYEIVIRNIDFLTERAEKKNLIVKNNVPEEMLVWCDIDQMNIVVLNILSNALKFTSPNGTVTVGARMIREAFVEVAITDTGVGMEQETMEKLFSIQQSQKGTAGEKGNGLGLSICKDFVIRNGGDIWAESKLGEGTTFYFTIPLSRERVN